ncbi:sensor domain-containing protein [Candidatus Protofrankia datiscae]|uniref:sensor domain-containing protein n=1 Tax=Candidatus Protofrankia datiscae TaxID=2716812 RepID=UPI0013EB8A2D|nr:EAL domain-containing protein [Candidatus Protofrankia datiscae]
MRWLRCAVRGIARVLAADPLTAARPRTIRRQRALPAPRVPPAPGAVPPPAADGAARDILDRLPEIVFRTDAQGRWTYLNPAWTVVTGFEVEASLGKHFLDYVHPDERDHTVALFMAVVAGGADHCHHVTRYRTRGGSYRRVGIRASLLRGPDGQIVGNLGTIIDATRGHIDAETVGEHTALLELVSDGAPVDDLPMGILLVDRARRIRRASPVVDRLIDGRLRAGDPLDRLAGLLRPYAGATALEGEWGLVATALRTEQPQHAYLSLRLAAGPVVDGYARERALRVSVIPEVGESRDLLAVVLQDVTDLRQAERRQAAVARLGQRALVGTTVGSLRREAAEVVRDTLGVPYCEVLGPVAQHGSVIARVLAADSPVVVDHGVTPLGVPLPGASEVYGGVGRVAGVAARVGAAGRGFGLLVAYTTQPREFAADEADFVQSVANVLAAAIERHNAEQKVRRQALHDPLTGLANRILLHDRISGALGEIERDGGRLALLLMDLDRFKEINDTLGHNVGDDVLREVAVRLGRATRPSDTVARLGGDEFAILLPSTPGGAADALAVAGCIRAALAERIDVGSLPLHVDGSIGITLAPADGRDPGTLVRCADVAMYRAKQLSLGVAVYAPDADQNRRERLELLGGLRSAIAGGQLVLHYQPKVDLRTGRTTAVEALVRWQHPAHGLVEPGRFVPFAEQSNLVKPLTRRVLMLVLDQARSWWDAGRLLPVAVNVSARMLHDAELISTVRAELDRTGLPPRALELELTESAVMVNTRNAMSVITRLRGEGIRISVDDFGTGYSSLAYLRDLPVHDLKIDKSFVVNVAHRTKDFSIVRSIIDLAHNLDLRVVAEGIESSEVCSLLRDLGCDEGQGFYLGHPVPPADLAA